jgi:hypothetical protein
MLNVMKWSIIPQDSRVSALGSHEYDVAIIIFVYMKKDPCSVIF